MPVRVELINTQRLVYLANVIMRVGHRNDRATLHKYGKFPDRSIEVVENTVTFVLLATEIINPGAGGQINTVADIIAFLINLGFLINGSYKEIRTIHILVLGSRSMRISTGIIQEHRTDKRHSVYRLFGKTICVRHQFGFQLQEHPVYGCGRFA